MEKGQGKGTDTLKKDNDFVRRGDVKRLLENTVCLHEELPAQIDIIPAADVVPVVRCGECKFADNYGLDLMCQKHSGITKSKLGEDIHFVEWHSKNFFCSDGVRMKNDG